MSRAASLFGVRVKQKWYHLTLDLPLTTAFLTLKMLPRTASLFGVRVRQKLYHLALDLPLTAASDTQNVVKLSYLRENS